MRELYRRDGVPEALKSGSATGIATAMRATGYFEAPVKRYAKGILGNAKSIAASLGEPQHVTLVGAAPAVRTAAGHKKKSDATWMLVAIGLGAAAVLRRKG